MKLTSCIERTHRGLSIAQVFAIKYESKLPEQLQSLSICLDSVSLSISLNYYETERDAILLALGDVFGRADWIASPAYDNKGWHWSKTVDSVCITIYYAQKTQTPETFPVPTNAFPLQLTES